MVDTRNYQLLVVSSKAIVYNWIALKAYQLRITSRLIGLFYFQNDIIYITSILQIIGGAYGYYIK